MHLHKLLTKIKLPKIGSLLQIRHSAKDPHGRVVEHSRVPVPGGRTVDAAALGH